MLTGPLFALSIAAKYAMVAAYNDVLLSNRLEIVAFVDFFAYADNEQ